MIQVAMQLSNGEWKIENAEIHSRILNSPLSILNLLKASCLPHIFKNRKTYVSNHHRTKPCPSQKDKLQNS